jgi:hypothetical protein
MDIMDILHSTSIWVMGDSIQRLLGKDRGYENRPDYGKVSVVKLKPDALRSVLGASGFPYASIF